jgi:hypothetical protein
MEFIDKHTTTTQTLLPLEEETPLKNDSGATNTTGTGNSNENRKSSNHVVTNFFHFLKNDKRNLYEPIPDSTTETKEEYNYDIQKDRSYQNTVSGCHYSKFFLAKAIITLVVLLVSMITVKYSASHQIWWLRTIKKANHITTSSSPHHETMPTLLSLVTSKTTSSSTTNSATEAVVSNNENYQYLYALDNPYYDLFIQNPQLVSVIDTTVIEESFMNVDIEWSLIDNENDDDDKRRTSQLPSMTVQWNMHVSSPDRTKDDHQQPTNDRDDQYDLLVFLCTNTGSNSQNETLVLEIASLEQVRSTHQKTMLQYPNHKQNSRWIQQNENTQYWYIPNIPSTLLRQSVCYWVYYYFKNDHSKKWYSRDESTDVYDTERYIPIGISNRYYVQHHYMLQPRGIHIAVTSQPNEMIVQFTTGGGDLNDNDNNYIPIVEYTMKQLADYDTTSTITNPNAIRVIGTTDTYIASDMCQEPANTTGPGQFISPGNLHTVLLSNLQSNTIYTYRVGIETGQGVIWDKYSSEFITPLVPGDDSEYVFLVYGDQGCPSTGWDNGQSWIDGMVQREVFHPITTPIRIMHHVGDLSYAQGAAHIWDAWLDMIQPISTYVPIMVAVGNHEYDHISGGGIVKDPSRYVTTESGFMPVWGNFANDSGGECGVPTSKRFQMPTGMNDQEIPNNGVFWYWYDYGLVRTIVLSSEHDLSIGSIQHKWLEYILRTTDRTITPWVIVELHRPLYEMEEALFVHPENVGIAMRYEFEDLLYDYNVDVVFSGHFHTYHRTYVYFYLS